MGNFTGGGNFSGIGGGAGLGGSGGMIPSVGGRGAMKVRAPEPPDEFHRETIAWHVALIPDERLERALVTAAKAGCHAAAQIIPIANGVKAQGEIHPAAGGSRVIVHLTLHAASLDHVAEARRAFMDAFEARLVEDGIPPRRQAA